MNFREEIEIIQIPEHHKLEKELVEVVDKALSRSLPSTFLCLSMGECVAATVTYFECMASHSHKWTVHFGKEPDKMARRSVIWGSISNQGRYSSTGTEISEFSEAGTKIQFLSPPF